MNSRFPLAVLVVALAIIAVVAWEPLRSRAGLLLPFPSPSPSASPSPAPQEPVAVEQEPAAAEPTPTPEVPRPRFDKCIKGSTLTVTSHDANQVNYRCESGATGAYLK
jgi:hypothetical protein